MKLTLFAFACLLLAVNALWVSPESDVITSVADGWNSLGAAASTETIRAIIALRQNNLDKLEKIFFAVSDPQSPEYGNFWTPDEITALVQPSEEDKQNVLSWMAQFNANLVKESYNKDYYHIDVTVEAAQRMFNVEFELFEHAESGMRTIRTTSHYRIPEEVASSVNFVAGLNRFPMVKKNSAKKSKSVGDVINITPDILRQRYNVTGVGKNSKNSQAVAEFQGQFYSPSDLSAFFKQYVSGSTADTVTKVVGSNSPDDPGTEAELDIQYIMGVAPGVPTWFYITEGDFFTALLQWATSLQNPGAPLVHSVSYGLQSEFDPGQSTRDGISSEFQKAGVAGLSIIIASGDSGCGCEFCVQFAPSFPATSPWITSVGATEFIGSTVGPEQAVTEFGSGGGFSWFFDRPPYQDTAVKAYLAQSNKPASFYYKSTGRGTPDVAALGEGFQVIVDGVAQGVAGTSASTPTFAGIVALLNEVRLNKGGKPLGFLNPFLYQTWANNAEAFFDVTQGNNSDDVCCPGFECVKGWDPVTGLGTPNFAILSTLV